MLKLAPFSLTDKNSILIILLFSFVLKGLLVFSTQVPNPDGILYINAAREFAQGNFQQGIEIYPMPFYPFLIMLFHHAIPDWIRAAQTISWLSMVLATIPLYLITKKLFGQKPAIWSIIAYSLAPHFNTIASDILRDPLGIFMLSLATLFALKSLQEKMVKNLFLASLFSILAFLCRSEFFLFPLFLLFFYGVIILIDRKEAFSFGRGFGIFIIIFLFFGTIIWSINDKNGFQLLGLVKFKTYFRSTTGYDFLNGYKHIYQLLKNMGNSLPNPSLTGNFAETARHYIWLIYFIALLETAVILIFPTNLFPLYYCNSHKEKYHRSHYFILGIILLFTISTYFFLVFSNYIQKRFLIIPIFFLFPWVGSGLHKLYVKICSYKRAKIFAVGLFILLFFILPVSKTLSCVGERNLSLKKAGIWIADHIEKKRGVKLLSNDNRIPFFAGLDKSTLMIDQNNLQKINSLAQKNKIQIIALAFSQKRKNLIPDLENYKILKEFQDRKNIVIIAVDKTSILNFYSDWKTPEQQSTLSTD